MHVFGTPNAGTNSEVAADDDCAICGHPLTAHDPIGLRYCAATVAGGLSRGCVCATRTYDGPDDTPADWSIITSTTAKDLE